MRNSEMKIRAATTLFLARAGARARDWKVAQQRRTPTPKAFARPRFAWKHSCPFVVKPQKIVRILLAADGANQIQARGCAARRIAYEKNS